MYPTISFDCRHSLFYLEAYSIKYASISRDRDPDGHQAIADSQTPASGGNYEKNAFREITEIETESRIKTESWTNKIFAADD